MKSLFRKWLIGDSVISEYSKITVPDDINEKVYLQLAGNVSDVSKQQWLVCIEPVVFAVWIENNKTNAKPGTNEEYTMYFGGSFNSNSNTVKDPVAVLSLNYFNSIEDDNGTLQLLTVKKSNIYHLNFVKTYLLFNRYYKKNGLTFSKFKSFTAAYSYPRKIRIISFRQNDYYNIFPMDLVGEISQHGNYVFGLRHSNVALSRIVETGKMVVCEASYKHKNMIFHLGKHHSASPPPPNELPFKIILSKNFGFYIPEWAESYKEIKIIKTINMGSHMLLWGEVIEEIKLAEAGEHLFLIHFLHYISQKNKGHNYTLVE